MNKNLKKILVSSLIGVTAITSVPSIVFAGDITNERLEQMSVIFSDKEMMQEMEQYAIEKNGIDLELCTKYKNIFDMAYAEKYIVINTEGKIEVKQSLLEKVSEDEYNVFVEDMRRMNDAIEIGICSFNQIDGNFETMDLNTFVRSINSAPLMNNGETNTLGVVKAATNLNLGNLVHNNYNDLESEFMTQMKYNPDGAFYATTGIFIAWVKPNGIWDYKTKPGYSPWNKEFNCTYGLNSSKRAIRTSEYIGNYNFGYTGQLLYPLTVLKTGSFVVSGFDPKDVEDYPAIEEGFADARNVE